MGLRRDLPVAWLGLVRFGLPLVFVQLGLDVDVSCLRGNRSERRNKLRKTIGKTNDKPERNEARRPDDQAASKQTGKQQL